MIQTYFSLSDLDSDTWVLDTAYRSHIYNSLQRLQNIKSLKRDNLELYGTSGESISVEAIGTYILELPSSKILELKNCYYMPKVIKKLFLYLCY